MIHIVCYCAIIPCLKSTFFYDDIKKKFVKILIVLSSTIVNTITKHGGLVMDEGIRKFSIMSFCLLLCLVGAGHGSAQECAVDADCNDGRWCTGQETCVNTACVPGMPPCDDANICTSDPCNEANELCLTKGCVATSPADPCCNEPICEGNPFCESDAILKPENVWTPSDEPFKQPVCLDNPLDLVGGIQFDVCEYVGGQPGDCMRCTDCELTERSRLFDCAVLELTNGCCRVIVFSTSPAGVITPGMCDIVNRCL